MFTNAVMVNAPSSDNAKSKRKCGLNGLWNTFVNTASEYEMKQYLLNSSKVMKKVLPTIVNTAVKRYELGQGNLVRSVAVLYEGGISSKNQYNRKRSKEIFEIDANGKKHQVTYMDKCKIPKLVDYKTVMRFVNSVDIGELHDIPIAKKSKLDKGVYQMNEDDNEGDLHPPVSGCFRDLEHFLVKLANLYLVVNQKRPGYLNWFKLPVGSFQVAIGADGTPFGKYNQATAWLVSFLNVVDRIASCNENHLICGANCSEEHPSMVEYGKQIRKDIERIEKKVYVIDGINVTFSFELVPSDMKWLAFISGELPNSAKYFLSFANVSKDDIAKVGCTYGGPSDDFQPWDYKSRVKIANSVAKFKSKLTQKQVVARTKITEFIANQKSRQELEPILGPVIDKGFAEPLHLVNNNWQFLFLELFE